MTAPGFDGLENAENCVYADDTMYVFQWPAKPLGILYWTPCSKCGKNHLCGEICEGCYNERYDEQDQEVHGATLGPIPTEDETKGQYIGVPGVAPHPVKELLNNGHCPTCGADVTQPDIPYAHKSVAGNIMPGHTNTEVPKEIKDLLWHDDEYESKDKQVNDRLIEAFRRGKGCK